MTVSSGVNIVVKGAASPALSLDVELTNSSNEPLEVYEHSLPWVGWYSLLLIAAKTDAPGTVLEKKTPVDDPGPGTTTLQPGQTLKGSISLVDRFPGFVEAVSSRDVIVFWSYQLQPLKGPALPRTAGYVLFPKQPKN
jgi:hypothetical protein